MFKKKIDKNFGKNDIYLDSLISASAINLDFFKKVEKLSPFGSGNPEPRFIIENLKVLKSLIIGKKHIKSILLSKDGSTLKTIAFNSYDTDLGQLLLNNKTEFIH